MVSDSANQCENLFRALEPRDFDALIDLAIFKSFENTAFLIIKYRFSPILLFHLLRDDLIAYLSHLVGGDLYLHSPEGGIGGPSDYFPHVFRGSFLAHVAGTTSIMHGRVYKAAGCMSCRLRGIHGAHARRRKNSKKR